MRCPNCGNDNWDIYETDGDGTSNDYVEHVVCSVCEAEYTIDYECKVLNITKTN